MTDVSEILTGVSELVLSSISKINEMRYDITWKADGSPVTAADVYLENSIQAFLSTKLPQLAFIGEESWTSGHIDASGWTAVLDPIDGTENFCSGLKEWGTSLSIWHGKLHAGSLLLMPELGESLSSGNIKFVPRSRIVGFSSSYCSEIGTGLSQEPEGRIMGCAVYNLFNVIRGAYARFVNPKGARSWDLLAGIALAREANCDIIVNERSYGGEFLEPDQRYRVDIRHRYDLYSGEGTVR